MLRKRIELPCKNRQTATDRCLKHNRIVDNRYHKHDKAKIVELRMEQIKTEMNLEFFLNK